MISKISDSSKSCFLSSNYSLSASNESIFEFIIGFISIFYAFYKNYSIDYYFILISSNSNDYDLSVIIIESVFYDSFIDVFAYNLIFLTFSLNNLLNINIKFNYYINNDIKNGITTK